MFVDGVVLAGFGAGGVRCKNEDKVDGGDGKLMFF